jgi:hypothetical protein
VTERRPRGPIERDPAALFRWLVDGVLVLAPAATVPSRITAPGDAVWAALVEPRTTASLTEELSARFAAPASVVGADLESLVQLLLDTGALRMAGPAPRAEDPGGRGHQSVG